MVILTILIFQSKIMAFLSICLCHFQFLSSVSYTFQSTGLLPPQVGLFLRYFILFDVMVNVIFSLISLSDLSLLVYKNATDIFLEWKILITFLIQYLSFDLLGFLILGPILIIYICLTNQQCCKLYLNKTATIFS